MLKKVLALTVAVLFATVGVASAQPSPTRLACSGPIGVTPIVTYPPGGPSITANTTTPPPGGSIILTANGFQSSVTFHLCSAPVQLGTATADSNGVATLNAVIPASTPPGAHTVEASGTGLDGAPLTLSLAITVAGAGATGDGLPRTGSSSTVPMTQIALATVAGGGLLVLLANKRRSAKQADQRETAGV